ncbi:MAG: cytochrome c maturation protein CcmE [Planctomycetota bacterium]
MKKKTIVKVLVGFVVIGGGLAYFMYQAMQSSWSYYYRVDEFVGDYVADNNAVEVPSVRIFGNVKAESVSHDLEKTLLTFTLAGSKNELPVHYKGSVPDNFTEGKDVVVQGRLDTNGVFQAKTLMTKCESKYATKDGTKDG